MTYHGIFCNMYALHLLIHQSYLIWHSSIPFLHINIMYWVTQKLRKSALWFCVSVLGRSRDLQYIFAVTYGPPSRYIVRLFGTTLPDNYQSENCFKVRGNWFAIVKYRFSSLWRDIIILGDPEVTANLYCNFAYLYLESCVICSIYLR